MEVKQHDAIEAAAEELPLVADEAVVTTVTAMDEQRHDEVADAVETLLDAHNEDDLLASGAWGPDPIDWRQVRDALDPSPDSTLATKLDSLQERDERPYPMLVEIRFDPDVAFEFAPGQYLTLRYDDVARPYSIASSPNDDDVALCVRHVPDGHLTPKLCQGIESDEEVEIRGPNGDFVLDEPSQRDMVFLATGTGAAPFYSMIHYTFEEGFDVVDGAEETSAGSQNARRSGDGHQRDVWLFLGSSWRDDIPYFDAFSALDEAHENFHFVPTCSRETYLSDWDGETAYVQHTLMKYLEDGVVPDDVGDSLASSADEEPVYDVDARIDPSNIEAYACGVSAMAYGLVDVAEAIGVPELHVHVEGFG
ncbi:FAD-binding oxidoreductase [Halomarina rubra]|uniref:FAD-binding oxidoreductase n=1 Tax=Halomarina rubra TaxID=2071873 RepID=A0ABD6AXR7_9EURY|nr:FAD-binding oxidoreductase [Halomarina rubra]